MNKKFIYLGIIVTILFVIQGCVSAPEFTPRAKKGPAIKYCNDITGHVKGAAPFILGGTCCCTPTKKMYDVNVAEGTIAKTVSYEEYLKMYKDKGITTDLDHKGCNNACEHGPHVVLGGKCMATPSVGTLNYEKVVSGNSALTNVERNHEKLY
ncbi:MAG: hypothetical protein LWX56_01980 [Ignavibacteria bacterium]|nr:hypothetical protein [Ignavibacteria bacterium]